MTVAAIDAHPLLEVKGLQMHFPVTEGIVINPLIDVQGYLPSSVYAGNYGNFGDPEEVDLYDKMLRETDAAKQRSLMRAFEKYVLDDQAHELFVLWQHRIVPHRSYVKGWKISPSFYVNQDLATIWLDR